MKRALSTATAMLLGAHVVWLLGTILLKGQVALGFLPWAAIPLAAFTAASLVGNRKFFVGMLVTVPSTALLLCSSFLAPRLGVHLPLSEVGGALMAFGLCILVSALLSAAGAAFSYLSPYRPV
jgi:hypothetical protein